MCLESLTGLGSPLMKYKGGGRYPECQVWREDGDKVIVAWLSKLEVDMSVKHPSVMSWAQLKDENILCANQLEECTCDMGPRGRYGDRCTVCTTVKTDVQYDIENGTSAANLAS